MPMTDHELQARMFTGGLKSMLIELVTQIEHIEETGTADEGFIKGMTSVKDAVDLTLAAFAKIKEPCCVFEKRLLLRMTSV